MILSSKSIYDPIEKAEIGRWHTGCYKNDEDDCFWVDTDDKTGQHSPLTGSNQGGFETYPLKKLKASLEIFICHKFSSPRKARSGQQMQRVRILA